MGKFLGETSGHLPGSLKIRLQCTSRKQMSNKEVEQNHRRKSRADTTDITDQRIDMEDQEEEETSAKVNEDEAEPDQVYEQLDENID